MHSQWLYTCELHGDGYQLLIYWVDKNVIWNSKGFMLIDSALDGKVEKRLESNYCGTLVWKMWVNLYRSIIEEGFEYQFFRETAPSYHRKQLPLTNLPHMQLPSLLLICIIDQPRIRSKNTLRNEYFIASLMLVSLPRKSISMKLKIIRGIQGTL